MFYNLRYDSGGLIIDCLEAWLLAYGKSIFWTFKTISNSISVFGTTFDWQWCYLSARTPTRHLQIVKTRQFWHLQILVDSTRGQKSNGQETFLILFTKILRRKKKQIWRRHGGLAVSEAAGKKIKASRGRKCKRPFSQFTTFTNSDRSNFFLPLWTLFHFFKQKKLPAGVNVINTLLRRVVVQCSFLILCCKLKHTRWVWSHQSNFSCVE